MCILPRDLCHFAKFYFVDHSYFLFLYSQNVNTLSWDFFLVFRRLFSEQCYWLLWVSSQIHLIWQCIKQDSLGEVKLFYQFIMFHFPTLYISLNDHWSDNCETSSFFRFCSTKYSQIMMIIKFSGNYRLL